MNIGLWQRLEELPDEIKLLIKEIGNDCYECILKWKDNDSNKPLVDPIENYIEYGNKIDEIQYLDNQGFLSILKAWLRENAFAAGAEITESYYGTREAAEQACCPFRVAKKWAAENGVKKSEIDRKTAYQWTEEDINRLVESRLKK